MQAFTSDELDRMRTAQQGVMMDTCQIIRRESGTADDYGYSADVWSVYLSSACGLKPVTVREAMGLTEVAIPDAQLRLPITLHGVIDNNDRIKITHRYGEALPDPVTYELMDLPQRGPSGLVLKLRKVTDGSDT